MYLAKPTVKEVALFCVAKFRQYEIVYASVKMCLLQLIENDLLRIHEAGSTMDWL